MKRLIIASAGKSAGKTSLIVGLGKSLNLKIGYMKPYGERLIYFKKRLWDYDANLINSVLDLKENPEDMTLGFEYLKLKYMYDETLRKQKLLAMAERMEQNKDFLLVECGSDLQYGISVGLDPVSLARELKGGLVIVLSGNSNSIIDDALFIKEHLNLDGVNFKGLVINKVNNPDDFKDHYLEAIKQAGLPVLGVIPDNPDLRYVSVDYIGSHLFTKVIAGENALSNQVKEIVLIDMPTESALKNPLFHRSDKLVITSGDRSDVIIAALDSNTAGIVLTNNVLPPSNIISKANDKNIPLLFTIRDTYQIASQIDDLEPLLEKDDSRKVELLTKLVKNNLDLKKITGV
ncbi:MAG TPA: DRTGG domain-containing protein [Planctomycetota bacterium]|nr:DRTGG domain-containing protein [Planctomycetota bacterium]